MGVPALICIPEIPTNPRESGSARKRHATTYSLDRGSPLRRLASLRIPTRPVPSHPVPSHPDLSRPVPTRWFAHGQFHYSYWRGEGGGLLMVRGGSGGRSGVCRRNYTIKWCPDGRQLGAPWYSPFSSCHSESICIVMAPRVASLPTPLRINTAADCHRKCRPSETKPSSFLPAKDFRKRSCFFSLKNTLREYLLHKFRRVNLVFRFKSYRIFCTPRISELFSIIFNSSDASIYNKHA